LGAAEFTISQTSGILDARSDQLIEVTFTGMQKAVYDHTIKIEIKDVDETPSLGVIQSIDLPLRVQYDTLYLYVYIISKNF
jgi:hypothetical protein